MTSKSSQGEDELDMNLGGSFSFQYTCMLPFWNPQGIRKPCMVTPSFLITIRKIRKLKDILQVGSRRISRGHKS
jgi:hypothetical protein